jgi:hypothetical protein
VAAHVEVLIGMRARKEDSRVAVERPRKRPLDECGTARGVECGGEAGIGVGCGVLDEI